MIEVQTIHRLPVEVSGCSFPLIRLKWRAIAFEWPKKEEEHEEKSSSTYGIGIDQCGHCSA